ncbi:hypothetical protein [Enterococcus faecalis]|uniref:hypothetical protein n=1 Tax=Enterococcus faecalis TaxID=1351 RepID=UPI001927C276|nr:hypothetical protein [Enterococcus faecalis]MCD4905482.1 hypothetical protein [Enterococcus faecalis]
MKRLLRNLFLVAIAFLFLTACSQKQEGKNVSDSSLSQNEPSEKQKDLLVAYTQQECEDRSIDLTYQGADSWNVAVQEIKGSKLWITTTKDKKYDKIKTIYEWNGQKDSSASLMYLLVGENELVNKMKD